MLNDIEMFLSPIAEQDIDEIITYLAQENPVVARTFLDALFAAMELKTVKTQWTPERV